MKPIIAKNKDPVILVKESTIYISSEARALIGASYRKGGNDRLILYLRQHQDKIYMCIESTCDKTIYVPGIKNKQSTYHITRSTESVKGSLILNTIKTFFKITPTIDGYPLYIRKNNEFAYLDFFAKDSNDLKEEIYANKIELIDESTRK